jgi:hypothetical protein
MTGDSWRFEKMKQAIISNVTRRSIAPEATCFVEQGVEEIFCLG